MKTKFTLLLIIYSTFLFSQDLKTFTGDFPNGKLQSGKATYTYYENPETYDNVRQGNFKYTFTGAGDYLGYNQTITGKFDKGLKTGTWTYSITMTNFGNQETSHTGTIVLTANYKNGYANGLWQQIATYKSRKRPYSFGKWQQYGAIKTSKILMSFKDGNIVGKVDINDAFEKAKITGAYDENSMAIGTWLIDDNAWNKHKELRCKDNVLYEFIARDNTGRALEGSTKYQEEYDNVMKAKNMTDAEQKTAHIKLNKNCGTDGCAATNNIKPFLGKLLSNDYYLYEFIGGDLTFKEGFNGGCDYGTSYQY